MRIFLALFLLVFFVGCESNLSPTSATGVGSMVSSNSTSESSGLESDCGNPRDWEPDDALLQNCLNKGGVIKLQPGEPGYIINSRTLLMVRSGTVLTSSQPPQKAKIIAGRDFFDFIFRAEGINDYSIEHTSFNGMVDAIVDGSSYRRYLGKCDDAKRPGNLILTGNKFSFKNSESVQALCGTGLGVYGTNFEITNNNILSNGKDKNSGLKGVPWADGLTLLYCGNGYIARNIFADNTDIDFPIGGGRGCVVELNTIIHKDKHGFAGLNIGNFASDRAGNHAGSEYRGNLVYSTRPNVLSIGILIGSHPWAVNYDVINAGKVAGNTSYGNVMNLVVEGVYGGEVVGNNAYNPQGEDSLCGRSQANFTSFPPHVQGVILQEGWVTMRLDEFSCNPQNQQTNKLNSFLNR